MNESSLTSQLLKRFRDANPRHVAWKISDRVARSRPDAVFVSPKRGTVYCEFKIQGNPVTPGQREELRRLVAAGATVWVGVFRTDCPRVDFFLVTEKGTLDIWASRERAKAHEFFC